MPRDSNKDNASSRGRSPGGKGGKSRSGAARGPDKKFAKRGTAKPEGGAPRSFDKPRAGGDRPYAAKKPYTGNRDAGSRDDRPKRDFNDRPKRDFADRPKRDFSERPASDASRPRFNRDDRAPRRDDARPAARSSDHKFGDKKPYTPRSDRPAGDRPFKPREDRGKRSFKPREDRAGGDRPFKPRSDRPFTPRGDRPAGDRPFKPREDRGERSFKPREDRGGERTFKPREDRAGGDRPFKPRSDRPFTPRGDRPAGDRPYKPREDRGERSFKPREDRGGERTFKPREDRAGGNRPFTPRGERPAGDRPFKPREDRPRGDRPFAEKRFGGEKKFGDRPAGRGAPDRGPRKDFGKDLGDRPSRGPRRDFSERPNGGERKIFSDRAPRRDDAPTTERPRFDRPREDRPRDDRGGDRPRFSRPREDKPRREPGSSWQEHPRSERGAIDDRPRRDNEDDSKIFAKRPAFGGRGEYRERNPDDRKSSRAMAAPKNGERIAKLVSRAGLCSRRDAELWITQGRVSVNGRVINSPALDVTSRDVVTVDGKPLPPPERTRLFLYHKPRGLMTTHADPEGRPTVFDQLPEGLPRLISVGRLDFNTEGLLLLTNDGGLARALELPDTGWLRRYRVRAHGEVTQAQLDQLKDGVEVDGVKYGPIDAQLERDQGANVWLVFAIREGKNREVRNVLAHLGLEVNRLIRVSYGPFQLGEIAEGQVDEIKTRVLREQLGDKIAAASNASFAVPPSSKGDIADDPPVRKPPGKRGVVADRKGRRVLVQRSGSDEARARNEEANAGYGPPKRPKRGYHGKRDLAPRD